MNTESRHRATAAGTLHLLRPDSVGTWFRHFARAHGADRVLVPGEHAPVAPAEVLALLEADRALDRVVVHSSHDTLVADRELADRLGAAGVSVLCQSRPAVDLAVDKLRMKEFFDRHGLPSLPWVPPGRSAPWLADGPAVAKPRGGTQSVGMALVPEPEGRAPGPDEYWEQYADGVEYSVVVYRDEAGWASLPPVWKGPTSSALVPPWRRLRLCPHAGTDEQLDLRLRELAVRTARLIDCSGHLEVEYLVDAAGRISILEINPRVSGTMRIAAMAADVPVFSLCDLGELRGHLPAVRCAAERPYQGTAFSDPVGGVFATSRLTVAADTCDQALEKLDRITGEAAAAARTVYAGV